MINKPKNISKKAQLLKGVGASSWFEISLENEKYRIKRYCEEGELECSRLFTSSPEGFEINNEYEFTYISHCKECTIFQNNKTYKFYTDEY